MSEGERKGVVSEGGRECVSEGERKNVSEGERNGVVREGRSCIWCHGDESGAKASR